jgi:hypothetical protein
MGRVLQGGHAYRLLVERVEKTTDASSRQLFCSRREVRSRCAVHRAFYRSGLSLPKRAWRTVA